MSLQFYGRNYTEILITTLMNVLVKAIFMLMAIIISSDKKYISLQLPSHLRPHGLPGSSVHRIVQARILEWVAISFSKGFSWLRDQTQSPALQADPLPSETPGELKYMLITIKIK